MSFSVPANGSSTLFELLQDYDPVLSIFTITFNGILCLPLNSYVAWLILIGNHTNLASDFFPLNLALSELSYSITSFFWIACMKTNALIYCELFTFFVGFVLTTRPLFQCSICVECYVGVVHPVFYLKYKHLRYKMTISLIFWLVSLCSCCYCRNILSNPLYLYGIFIQNWIFFFVMLFCCLATVKALKDPGPGEKVNKRKKTDKMKRRALKIIQLIMTFMTFNFLLYVCVVPLQCCISNVNFNRALAITSMIAYIFGFTQPLLYLHRNGKLHCFRKLSTLFYKPS